jgi:hypothetical protein
MPLRGIEAFEDAQRQQVLEALAGRRRHVHGAAAIGDRHRIHPRGLGIHQIVHGEAAAQFVEPLDQFLAERPAMQQARPLGRERFE